MGKDRRSSNVDAWNDFFAGTAITGLVVVVAIAIPAEDDVVDGADELFLTGRGDESTVDGVRGDEDPVDDSGLDGSSSGTDVAWL